MSEEAIVVTMTPADSWLETGETRITGYNLSASGVPVWTLSLIGNEKLKRYTGFLIIQMELSHTPSGIMLEKMKSGVVKLNSSNNTELSLISRVSILGEIYECLRYSSTSDEFMLVPDVKKDLKPSLLIYDTLVTEQKNQIKRDFLRGIAEKVRGVSTEQSKKGEQS